MTARLLASGAFDAAQVPNHCLLNRYDPGCGINAHNDGPLYMPRVAILSLQSSCVFEFVPLRADADNDEDAAVIASVFVPKRSLVRNSRFVSVLLHPYRCRVLGCVCMCWRV